MPISPAVAHQWRRMKWDTTMYDELKSKWNRDRIAEIRGEFHWTEFGFGFAIGWATLVVILIFA